MKFSELPVGALFKIAPGGSVLRKTGKRSSDPVPPWKYGIVQCDPEEAVTPYTPPPKATRTQGNKKSP